MEGLDKYLTNEPMTNDKWDGLYNIVYADPAWKFGSRLANGNDKNGIVNLKQVKIEDNYTVMTTDDICRLPIKNMTADDAILFLWTTDAHLEEAMKVINAWGFKYKTVAFIWNKKEKSGKQVCFMGQWTMKGSEIVLLGTKGKMTQHLKSRKVRQLQEAPRERTIHSRKPQIIRDRIVEMFGNELKKIELFARIKTDGWDVFGNEVEGSVNLETSANNGR
jgi:site-specific DNA-methyltransferase (adenine-specific)